MRNKIDKRRRHKLRLTNRDRHREERRLQLLCWKKEMTHKRHLRLRLFLPHRCNLRITLHSQKEKKTEKENRENRGFFAHKASVLLKQRIWLSRGRIFFEWRLRCRGSQGWKLGGGVETRRGRKEKGILFHPFSRPPPNLEAICFFLLSRSQKGE